MHVNNSEGNSVELKPDSGTIRFSLFLAHFLFSVVVVDVVKIIFSQTICGIDTLYVRHCADVLDSRQHFRRLNLMTAEVFFASPDQKLDAPEILGRENKTETRFTCSSLHAVCLPQ